MTEIDLRPESVVVAAGRPHVPDGPINAPVVLAAPYRAGDENAYARHDVTETIAALQDVLGRLDGGSAYAFGSGVAAISAVIELLPVGAVVVAPRAAYAGTMTIFDHAGQTGRLTVRHVDIGDTDEVVAALDGAAMVWLETVTNPLLVVADLPAIVTAAHAADALVAVDATFSTPLVARPLDLGADVVVHSATKYFGGHSDVLLGAVIVRDPELGTRLHDQRTLTGALPGALETYLTTRGIRTLALRMERAQANAGELARRLAGHDAVARVRYPGLPDDPGHKIAERDHLGFGAVVGIELVGGADAADAACERFRLITHATSLGGVESLVERRAAHPIDAAFGTPPSLLRLSVGIEHVEDLWADLEQALA